MSKRQKLCFRDFEWILVLFGTAIGAGILFLPLQASISGFIPLTIAAIIIFPVIYYAEKNLAELVLVEKENLNITEVFYKRLGHKFAFISTIIYFLSCYTVIIAYATALPITVSGALNLYGVTELNLSENPLFCFVVLAVPVLVMIARREIMLQVLSIIIYPLIVCILIISCALIPHWSISNLNLGMASVSDVCHGLLAIFPILVFSMNYCQSISQMIFYYKEHSDDDNLVKYKVKKNIYLGTMLITLFTMFFIFSSILAVPAEKVREAAVENVSILHVIASLYDAGMMHYIGPVIALSAILSSFLGVFLGTLESCNGIIIQILNGCKYRRKINVDVVSRISIILIFVSLWLVAVFDVNVLYILGLLTAPSIAVLVFILPASLKLFKNTELTLRETCFQLMLFVVGLIITFGYAVDLLS